MAALRALVISFTDTTAEPRVLRQLSTLERQKIPFVVASFASPGSHNEAVGFVALSDSVSQIPTKHLGVGSKQNKQSFGSALWQRFDNLTRLALRLVWFVVGGTYGFLPISRRLLGANSAGKTVSQLWFRLGWRETRKYSRRIEELLTLIEFEPNLLIFHDYFTSKLAFELAERRGAKTVFDVHEHAITQYSNQPGWLGLISPLVRDIEEEAAKKSDAIITVGEEIRKLLINQYGVSEKTLVVRSVSEFSEQSFRPSSYPIKLLYSGAISPERGLTELVQSMVKLQDRFRLTIKGPVTDPKFEVRLREKITELHLRQTVILEEPCDYHHIVPNGNTHDIGIFVQPNSSKHKLYTLPNKFFSYVASGLALCVSDYPELARITREWGFGILVDNCSPESIVVALGQLSVEKVDSLKKRSLIAARELNWQKEELVLINLLEEFKTSYK